MRERTMQQRARRYGIIAGLIGVGVCAYLSRSNGQETRAPQNADLQALLHNSSYPLTLQLKDLNQDWRRVSIGGQAEAGVHTELASSLADNVYYTRGETINMGGETYLVAYQIENPNKYASPLSATYDAYETPRLSMNTRLTLNLVNMRMSTGLYDVTPLNVQDEIKRTNGNMTPSSPTANQATGNQ
jgi:hypothetical protein